MKLLAEVHAACRQQHFARSTEQVETTMIYTHVANLGTLAVSSPLDLVST
ncbi:MAG: hypothetical protein L0211_16805 [Planctomycetaceae bacterium]|nr:hypothetical protein [Planctomycetaceae bacterium]